MPVTDEIVAAMRKINPGYVKGAIKAGTYPKQDKDVPAIGYTTHIVAACDLPEDVVYRMTKAMATGVNDMAAVVKPIAGLTAKDMAVDIGVPFHNLPRFHHELTRVGWIQPGIEYPSYRALWRRAGSRPEPLADASADVPADPAVHPAG